ncbi:MAG: hypothetical protein V1806_00555 [Pseudomonadota bacterium]
MRLFNEAPVPAELKKDQASQEQEGLRLRIIGFRWVASQGKDDCPQCAALHDKVFYFYPKPGQASVEDMPRGQLHPNCDCTREPVKELLASETPHPPIKPYMEGKVKKIAGLLFRRSSLNSLGEAPIYGKY